MVLYPHPVKYDLSYMIRERRRLLEQIRTLKKQIVIWEFQPYQKYFDLHKDEYEFLEEPDEKHESLQGEKPSNRSNRKVAGSVREDENVPNPRRLRSGATQNQVNIARRNPKRLRAGKRFESMKLDEKVVKRVRHPFRRSDWVLKPRDRFRPEVVDTFDLVYKPISLRYLLSNPQIKTMVGRFASK